jgi:hypothetical protein
MVIKADLFRVHGSVSLGWLFRSLLISLKWRTISWEQHLASIRYKFCRLLDFKLTILPDISKFVSASVDAGKAIVGVSIR